jgi:hypothetical protein
LHSLDKGSGHVEFLIRSFEREFHKILASNWHAHTDSSTFFDTFVCGLHNLDSLTCIHKYSPSSTTALAMDWMKIMIIYRKPCCKLDKCIQVLGNCGAYTHCELYCPEMLYNGKIGWTFTNFSFYEMEMTQESVYQYKSDPQLFDAHEILIRPEQHAALLRWNLELVARRCSYNYSDLFLHLMPKRIASALRPDDKNMLTIPKKLYCAQAVILALKHALGPRHRVSQSLTEINIHLSKPSCIADKLSHIFGAPSQMRWCSVI